MISANFKNSIVYLFICLSFWSCTETSAGSFTMVLSGSVHGQLDPCG